MLAGPRSSVVALVAAMLTAALATPSTAAAPEGATIALSKRSTPPTTSIAVHGLHFGMHERVDLSLDATLLATTRTDAAGGFTMQVTIPPSALPGSHAIGAAGEKSGLRVRR